MQKLTSTTSPEPNANMVLGVSASPMSRDDLINIGFKELPHFTVMQSLIYDLGRKRQLSIGCLGNPNEMVFICQIDTFDNSKITDLVTLRNYDYDGFTSIEDIKKIIKSITGNNVIDKKPKSRCCGRCDGINDLCVTDMVCDEHATTGCEICYGAR